MRFKAEKTGETGPARKQNLAHGGEKDEGRGGVMKVERDG